MIEIGGRGDASKCVGLLRSSRLSVEDILDQCCDYQRNDDGTCQVHPAHAPYPIIVHHGVSLRVCQQFDFQSSDGLIALVSAEALARLRSE